MIRSRYSCTETCTHLPGLLDAVLWVTCEQPAPAAIAATHSLSLFLPHSICQCWCCCVAAAAAAIYSCAIQYQLLSPYRRNIRLHITFAGRNVNAILSWRIQAACRFRCLYVSIVLNIPVCAFFRCAFGVCEYETACVNIILSFLVYRIFNFTRIRLNWTEWYYGILIFFVYPSPCAIGTTHIIILFRRNIGVRVFICGEMAQQQPTCIYINWIQFGNCARIANFANEWCAICCALASHQKTDNRGGHNTSRITA